MHTFFVFFYLFCSRRDFAPSPESFGPFFTAFSRLKFTVVVNSTEDNFYRRSCMPRYCNGTPAARVCIRNGDKTRSFSANGRSGTPFVAACKNGSGSCWKTTVISPKNIHSFRAHYPYRPAPLLAVSFHACLFLLPSPRHPHPLSVFLHPVH